MSEVARSQFWPSWRYFHDGKAEIFDRPEDVPQGWVDHPSKLNDDPAPAPVAAPAVPVNGRAKKAAAAAALAAYREQLLAAARTKFPAVPEAATVEELESALGAEAVAALKAADGNGK